MRKDSNLVIQVSGSDESNSVEENQILDLLSLNQSDAQDAMHRVVIPSGTAHVPTDGTELISEFGPSEVSVGNGNYFSEIASNLQTEPSSKWTKYQEYVLRDLTTRHGLFPEVSIPRGIEIDGLESSDDTCLHRPFPALERLRDIILRLRHGSFGSMKLDELLSSEPCADHPAAFPWQLEFKWVIERLYNAHIFLADVKIDRVESPALSAAADVTIISERSTATHPDRTARIKRIIRELLPSNLEQLIYMKYSSDDEESLGFPISAEDHEKPSTISPHQLKLLEQLKIEWYTAELVADFRKKHGPRRSEKRGQGKSRALDGTGQAPYNTAASRYTASTSHTSRRRKVSNRPGDDSEGEDGGGEKSLPKDKTKIQDLKFACPFLKRSWQQSWRWGRKFDETCGRQHHSNITYVKQHLWEYHWTEWYCDVCFAIYDAENGLTEHKRWKCSPGPDSKEMFESNNLTRAKRIQIKHRSDSRKDPETLWKRWFTLIFPDQQQAPSPYWDTATSQEREKKIREWDTYIRDEAYLKMNELESVFLARHPQYRGTSKADIFKIIRNLVRTSRDADLPGDNIDLRTDGWCINNGQSAVRTPGLFELSPLAAAREGFRCNVPVSGTHPLTIANLEQQDLCPDQLGGSDATNCDTIFEGAGGLNVSPAATESCIAPPFDQSLPADSLLLSQFNLFTQPAYDMTAIREDWMTQFIQYPVDNGMEYPAASSLS